MKAPARHVHRSQGKSTSLAPVFIRELKQQRRLRKRILGDPGADSGDEEKSKRAEKYMARRKVKNGEKSPWGQCLTRPVPNGRRRSGFWLVPENLLDFSSSHYLPLGLRGWIHCSTLKFQDKPIPLTSQKSALQHSLFWRYANFSKIMRTIHTTIAITF